MFLIRILITNAMFISNVNVHFINVHVIFQSNCSLSLESFLFFNLSETSVTLNLLCEFKDLSLDPHWSCHFAVSQNTKDTHGVDAGQLLRELQDDGDDDRLTIVRRAEEIEHGHFLFHSHLHPFFLHLLNVIVHVFTATQALQCCTRKKDWIKVIINACFSLLTNQ